MSWELEDVLLEGGDKMEKKSIKVKVTETEFIPVEDGIYEGKLVDIEEATGSFGGKTTEIWRWHFTVETDEGEEARVIGVSSRNFSTRSKAYKWWTSITGIKPEANEEVDLMDAVGKKCLVEIENREGQGGTRFPNVVDVKQLPKRGRKV